MKSYCQRFLHACDTIRRTCFDSAIQGVKLLQLNVLLAGLYEHSCCVQGTLSFLKTGEPLDLTIEKV